MPGARYDSWHHLRYGGDRELAAQHLPLARKVLGFVRDQAAVNGLQTYKHVVELDDGGLIVGELIGGQLRATIVVGPSRGRQLLPLVAGFIAQLSDEVDVGGRSRDPVVFSPPGEDESWAALFYGADSFGAEETDEDVRGTYSHVFAPRDSGVSQLPSGALWTSQDGEAVSWFRGYSSYWPPHYAHPGASYGRYVSIYGNIVFVAPEESHRVMAAAARDGHLYVWIASGLWEYPNYTPPAPSICGDIWVTQPYPDMAHVFRLYRLPLKVTTDARGVQVYKASNLEDGELLLDTPLPRAWGAWAFNRDVTNLVSVQLPKKAVFYTPSEYYPSIGSFGPGYAPSNTEHSDLPSNDTLRFEVAIVHSNGAATATFAQSPAGGVTAEEDGIQLELVQHELFHDAGDHRTQVNYRCGGWELLATRIQDTRGGGDIHEAERNILLAAHLPTKSFLFYNVKYRLAPEPTEIVGRYRVFYADANGDVYERTEVDGAPLDGDPLSTAAPELATQLLLGGVVSTMGCGLLNVAGNAYEWFREWDGPTTLLTITYNRSFRTLMPPSGETDNPADTAWRPIWAGPMVSFSWSLGERYGAGGVYFGSRNFTGPWTWGWVEGGGTAAQHIVHFNGVRINTLDAATYNVFFGAAKGLTYDPRTDPADTVYIADETAAKFHADWTYDAPTDAPLFAALAQSRKLRYASRGAFAAAVAGLDAALPAGDRLGARSVLGHTGKPRREQRAGVDKA